MPDEEMEVDEIEEEYAYGLEEEPEEDHRELSYLERVSRKYDHEQNLDKED